MSLSSLKAGEQAVVTRIPEIGDSKRFLESLGVLPGTSVSVVACCNGDMLLAVRGSRIAVGKSVSEKLTVSPVM